MIFHVRALNVHGNGKLFLGRIEIMSLMDNLWIFFVTTFTPFVLGVCVGICITRWVLFHHLEHIIEAVRIWYKK